MKWENIFMLKIFRVIHTCITYIIQHTVKYDNSVVNIFYTQKKEEITINPNNNFTLPIVLDFISQ